MTVLLVEGASDQRAVLTLAARLGHDLGGVDVISMQGITNLARHLAQVEVGRRTLGLYDIGEAAYVASVLERVGGDPSGFFACDVDLEDELIRALGAERVLQVVDEQGGLTSFRTLQKQAAHRGRPVTGQLRRFLSSHSGHKLRYAGLLVEALDLDRVPPPLGALIASL